MRLPFAFGVVLFAAGAFADSPLTSIDFSTGYQDVAAVVNAKKEPSSAFAFLASEADSGEKLAVISVLGWQTDFATGFLAHLAKEKQLPVERLAANDLTPSQLFAAAFLIATTKYLDLKPLRAKGNGLWAARPLELMTQAARQLPDDFAVQYARSLVIAQVTMDDAKKWCEVFRGPDAVVRKFPPTKRNLRPAALEVAQGYLAGYADSCPQNAERIARTELNQIYTLSQVGRQIVAGTQRGIVVWDPDQPSTPVAVRDGFICRGLSWKGAAWLGCETEVVRWDGQAFQPLLSSKEKGAGSYFELAAGPEGPWVYRGDKAWVWNGEAQRFDRAKAPWSGLVSDATYAHGQWFWADFLKAIHTSSATFAKDSAEYPGHAPSTLTVDQLGRLWSLDFDSGPFLYDPTARRFVKAPGVDTKVSGLAVDVERKRTWMLHYTQGPVLLREGRAPEPISLPQAEYMRDLLLDASTGDLWVAGWHQLFRLRADGPTWAKQTYVVR